MDLKQANKELEKLENDYEYYLQEKEQILSLVSVSASQPKEIIVKGGKRVDRYVKYVELEEEKQINATLDYIHKRKQNLLNWIDEELKILGKYGETEKLIVQLKENTYVYDSNLKRERPLTWKEIAKKSGYNEDHCRKIYRLYKKKRLIY